jgi:hypothetical protein
VQVCTTEYPVLHFSPMPPRHNFLQAAPSHRVCKIDKISVVSHTKSLCAYLAQKPPWHELHVTAGQASWSCQCHTRLIIDCR